LTFQKGAGPLVTQCWARWGDGYFFRLQDTKFPTIPKLLFPRIVLLNSGAFLVGIETETSSLVSISCQNVNDIKKHTLKTNQATNVTTAQSDKGRYSWATRDTLWTFNSNDDVQSVYEAQGPITVTSNNFFVADPGAFVLSFLDVTKQESYVTRLILLQFDNSSGLNKHM